VALNLKMRLHTRVPFCISRLSVLSLIFASAMLLIAGCSDSRTSTVGASLARNSWQQGIAPTLTSPADTSPMYQSLIPGESYTFTWIGGAGALATLRLKRYEEAINTFVTQILVENIPNNGSYRMLLPSSLPRGLYLVNLATYYDHPACGQVAQVFHGGQFGDGYFSWYPRAISWSPSKQRAGFRDVASRALVHCNTPAAYPPPDGVCPPNWCAPTTDCQLIDVNGSVCKGGAAGESGSHFFTIGPVDQGVVDQALAYLQIENSQSNQAAAAAQSKNTDEQAAPTPTNVVQVSNENDAKDDKSVTHLANSGVAGGR